MKIPIRNIYHMLCYAWQNLDSIKNTSVDRIQGDNLVDLFARILNECVRDLVEHGLYKDYVETIEEYRGIKAKLLITETLQKSLLRVGKSICTSDEYSLNNNVNQIIASTIDALPKVDCLDSDSRKKLLECARYFNGVDKVRISTKNFSSVRLTRLNNHYAYSLKVCALIWEQLLPDDQKGRYLFQEFDRDEVKMRKVFEDFVRNFFKIETDGFDYIKAETISWKDAKFGSENKNLLPLMRTDTSLKSSSNYWVIETKFVRDALQQRMESFEKIRSAHLYQIMAYLENIRRNKNIIPRGILLYPQVDRKIFEEYRLWDFDVQIRTIDLTQEWEKIREDLLDLVKLKDVG